jgi:uncharacterized membrane protein HdeD (DUF308 family)
MKRAASYIDRILHGEKPVSKRTLGDPRRGYRSVALGGIKGPPAFITGVAPEPALRCARSLDLPPIPEQAARELRGEPGRRQARIPMTLNESGFDQADRIVTISVRDHWKLFLIEGIVLVILGCLAVAVPPIASLAVEIVIGWIFLVSGLVGLFTTYMMRSLPGFWWSLLSAIMAILAGIVLLAWPLTGILSLTLVLIVFFVIEGVASIMYALDHRSGLTGRWGWMLASGIIDLILAAIIVAGLPGSAAWAIGIIVGVNMLLGGVSLIAIALHARPSETARTGST